MAKKQTQRAARANAAKRERGSAERLRGAPPLDKDRIPQAADADVNGEVPSSTEPMEKVPGEPRPPFVVVGIGASAGGVEALGQFFRAMPVDTGMVFVVVQHIAPSQGGMPDVLRSATRMPVAQAQDGMRLEPGHVYVAPPQAQVEIKAGVLHLIPRPSDHTRYTPIDHFFRSLAEYAGSRAVGIVLSGMGSDGSAGLREVKAAGGIAVAQEPATAQHDSMPHAAIATGAVDLVLAPPAIADELVRIAGHPLLNDPNAGPPEDLAQAEEAEWTRVFRMLRNASGVDFTHYKRPTIQRRLYRRMVLHKVTTVGGYLQFLRDNPAEVKSLYHDLLIHVTRFFRDPESFASLATKVFPTLRETGLKFPLRIWVPGCSTGEEAYSIAITLVEFLGDDAGAIPIQIFATDVSELAIERARTGIFADHITADVSPERLRRFFTKVDGHYRVSKTVRDMCVFARQDLTRDPPFSKLDLIVCRNVLIYLDVVLQKRLMTVFHYALKPTGFLMLGSAETIGPYSDLFAVTDKRHKVFAKKAGAATKVEIDLLPPDHQGAKVEPGLRPAPEAPAGAAVQQEVTRIILSRYAPPGVIIDNELRIVQFRGQTGDFLEPAPGEASLQLLKMAREGLLFGLRSAVQEAQHTNSAVRKEGLRVKREGVVREVAVQAIPLASHGPGAHFLILFEMMDRKIADAEGSPAAPAKPGKGGKAAKTGGTENQRIARLQQELAANREYLQSIIQDLEAANEELQSANEEILSSNEELQSINEELDTAKEELQSTNEELNTVNEELQGRNEELSRVNSDLTNLLASVQIAIVMVAGDLRIRRFTPMAEEILNLIPTDVGRRISDIKPKIDCPNLANLIIESIETVGVRERVVKSESGGLYMLRIRPYKNLENRIDGAVIALFDTQSDSRYSELIEAQAYAEGLLETIREPLLVLDSDLRVRSANKAFCEIFSVSASETEGQFIYDLGNRQWNIPRLRALLQDVLPKNRRIEGFRVEHEFPGMGPRVIMINARRLERGDHSPGLILLAMEDITGHEQ
ncbi:MAG: two-component hybrid sensor and regulator [Phycisphaerales bacterium]|nr:two-component hybrid sensor and regulator [Phycisphaerales bacterium]